MPQGRYYRESPRNKSNYVDWEKVIPIAFITLIFLFTIIGLFLPKDILYTLSKLPLYLEIFR